MPWCPRCDETFPQGPACPRCSARLVARERETLEDTLETVPGLRQFKVSRRYARAFEKLSGPRVASSRALALALVVLVFASGFLLGRVGTMGPTARTVTSTEQARGMAVEDMKGSIAYVSLSRELATVVLHDVFSGFTDTRTQLSPPVDPTEHVTTTVATFGRSVAVVMTNPGGRGFVALAPHGFAPQGWLPGIAVAWSSERDAIIRAVDGSLTQWSFDADADTTEAVGSGDDLWQTSTGPAVRRGVKVSTVSSPHRSITLPAGSERKAVAVSPDTSLVLLDGKVPTLWDGHERIPMRNGSGTILGAAFDHTSERVAVVLRSPDGLQLAIVDGKGNASLKPLSNGDGCRGMPTWDASSRWVYVSDGDGTVYSVEAAGGRVESVRTGSVGCGVAWVDIA